MRKYFISTFAAIALAVPLGIGGLAVTVPVTATDANAVSAAHHFSTCSSSVIWKCDRSIHTAVLFDTGINRMFASGLLPRGSNGIDQGAYAYVEWVYRTNHLRNKYHALRYLHRFHRDDDIRDYNARLEAEGRGDERFAYPWGYGRERWNNHDAENTGHISPDFRSRWRSQVTQRDQARAQLIRENTPRVWEMFRNDCQWNNGQIDTSGFGPGTITVGSVETDIPVTGGKCIVTEGEVDFTGFDPENPEVYWQTSGNFPFEQNPVVAQQISPINPVVVADLEDIVDHRTATSVNRGEIIELQEEFTEQNDIVEDLEPTVASNTQILQALGNGMETLANRVTQNREQIDKNTAGIALAYALDAPGLSYGRSYAIAGSVGHFSGESAVGFTGTFKIGGNWLGSIGGGFAGSGAAGGKASVVFEW